MIRTGCCLLCEENNPLGKRVTGCTFQRPQEEGSQAEAGIEEDPEAPAEGQGPEGQGRGGLSGSPAFLPPGTVLTVVTCRPTLQATQE